MFGNATYKGKYRKISNKSNSASKPAPVFDKQWLSRVSDLIVRTALSHIHLYFHFTFLNI